MKKTFEDLKKVFEEAHEAAPTRKKEIEKNIIQLINGAHGAYRFDDLQQLVLELHEAMCESEITDATLKAIIAIEEDNNAED